jgi:hypothetical protein
MGTQKHKVKLSPQLQLGVGRNTNSGSWLKYSSFIFLVISAVLAIRAGYMVVHGPEALDSARNPQVLGAKDSTSNDQSPFKEYSVKKGDSIFSIGQQYGIEWTTLATLNGLKPPFDLKIGQKIKVPTQ